MALRATAERIGERFANHDRDLPQGEVGIVEVAPEPGRELWWQLRMRAPEAAYVRFASRPLLAPLIPIAGTEEPRGVALISAERVRLLEWRPGGIEELHAWELSVFSRDWRERKAPRVADPARAQSISSSGREQFRGRLDDSRQRFLGQCRQLALEEARRRGWPEVLAFGPAQHLDRFLTGSEAAASVERGDDRDLISASAGEVEAHVVEAIERHRAESEVELASTAIERGAGGDRGSAGVDETLAALREARVEHLVLDARLTSQDTDGGAEAVDAERLVRLALQSGAAVSALRDEAAERLAPAGGVAALLRY